MGLRPPNESVCPELDSGTVVNNYIIENFLPPFLNIIIVIIFRKFSNQKVNVQLYSSHNTMMPQIKKVLSCEKQSLNIICMEGRTNKTGTEKRT